MTENRWYTECVFRLKKKSKAASFRNVGLFTAAYLLVASFFAFSDGNWEFILYIAVVVILGGLTVWMHKHAHFPISLLWALSIWGLLHMMGGLLPTPEGWPVNGDKHVFYSLWIWEPYLKYDHFVHAYGFGLATWGCWRMLLPVMDRKQKNNTLEFLRSACLPKGASCHQ